MTAQDTAQGETVLRLSGITKRFGALTANDAISFSLAYFMNSSGMPFDCKMSGWYSRTIRL